MRAKGPFWKEAAFRHPMLRGDRGPNPARTYTELRSDVRQIGQWAWYEQGGDKSRISYLSLENNRFTHKVNRVWG